MIRVPALIAIALTLLLTPRCLAQPEARLDPLHPDYTHDAWDTQPKDVVRQYRAYTASFDGPDDNDADGQPDVWAVPEWVSYELRRGPDRTEFEPRPSTWHTVRQLYQQRVAPRDQSYLNSGYDRGHLCMRNHARRLGQNADWNSHSMLNAVPQEHKFNDGHWLSLEKWCAIWANSYGKVWVIAGPVMQSPTGLQRPDHWIGLNNEKPVAIPPRLFKIVVKESDDATRPDVLAFIYDNDPTLNDKALDANHIPFLKSVDEIEDATGLDFFASLSTAEQQSIESNAATELWPVGALEERSFRDFAAEIDRLYDEDSAAETQAAPPAAETTTANGHSPATGNCCRPTYHNGRQRRLLFWRRCR